MASSIVTRDDVALELRAVSKTYGVGYFAKPVVHDCSFTVERGKVTVMIGPSGVGKSALVRLIAGFEQPTSGEIFLNGTPVRGPGRDRLVVFQETALFPWMTTRDNVLYGPMARGARAKGSRPPTRPGRPPRVSREVSCPAFRRHAAPSRARPRHDQ